MTLKDLILKSKKEESYSLYRSLTKKAIPYTKITRNDIYNNIISLYKDDPERILKLCSIEEINILKNLLDNPITKKEHGYIDYLLFKNLLNNFLVIDSDNKYQIPSDLYNYVKMALNLFDDKTYSYLDVLDSVIIGSSRAYNMLSTSTFLNLIKNYYLDYDLQNLKEYINHNPKLRNKVTVIKYKKEEYIISLEFNYYKDVYTLKESFNLAKYTLEELISIGKYKINLFQEHLFSFLNFLEIHLDPHNIDLIINDLIFYCGFDINNDSILLQICDNIEELYKEVKEVIPNFPIWIYNGNTLNTLKDSIILPNKNEPCLCGSGKKYKNCCEKLFK